MHCNGYKTRAMNSENSKNRSMLLAAATLKAEALRLGFSHCGLTPAASVPDAVMAQYTSWLHEGRQGEMHYLENHLSLRHHPHLLLPEVKTIVSLAMSYNPGNSPTQPAIAWYAQGRDYHDVLRSRARELVRTLYSDAPLSETSYRICVDTAPIMEKYWAWRCGLGWIGRHTQLVIPRVGSAFFLAEILLPHAADHYDQPLSNAPNGERGEGCGACRRCLDTCPTKAITKDGMDARRCLSYLTIEYRGKLSKRLGNCFYGCDRCLRACPHLSLQPTPIADFRPSPQLLDMTQADWQHLTHDRYLSLFRGSAVKRAKYEGLLRNIAASQSALPQP